MSPASQGALEVERYIGSCLISSSVRSLVGGKALIPGTAKKQQEIVSFRGKQQRDYVQPGNYISSNEQCQYGTWAGAPLISMTSSPRRSNQRLSPPPCQNQQQPAQQHQAQQTQAHMQNQSPLSRLAIHTQGAPLILAGRFHNRGKIQSCNGMNGTLMKNSGTNILNSNVNGNAANYSNGNTISGTSAIGSSIANSGGKCIPIRGQRLAETSRKPQQQQQSQQSVNSKVECVNGKVDGTNIANIDSLSIASDESSGSNNSENSLPRIIKPRKRRKKDRKPAGSGVTVTEITAKTDDHHHHQQQQQQNHQQQQPQQQQSQQSNQQQQQNHPNGTGISEQSSIVTLKPYVPICYETRYDQNRGHRRPQSIGKESYPRSQNQNVSCNGPMQQLNHQHMSHQQQEIVDTRQQQQHHHHQQQQQQQPQQQRYAQRHAQMKMLDDNKNVIVPTTSMLGRSVGQSCKGSMAGSTNYHHRNQHHMFHHHHHHHHHQHNDTRSGNNNTSAMVGNGSGLVNTLPRQCFTQPSYQQNQQQSQHDYEPMLMGCEDSASLSDGPSGSVSTAGCQCRYCDPSGLIWDVDQNVYSPFLTPPHASEFPITTDYGVSQQRQFAHLPLFLSRTGSAITCPEQRASNGCEYFELPESPAIVTQRGHNNNNRHRVSRCVETAGATTCTSITGNSCNGQPTAAVTMLRRSWSDPTSYFSEEISAPSRDVGVIGDRGQAEITRGRSSWPGSTASGLTSATAANSPYGNLANLPISSQGLEVSTEIVTSLNGHRDLEIKFYSSSPSAIPVEDDKSAFLDDGEDFSDIWSYHESKLQQDFRTLLQAEE